MTWSLSTNFSPMWMINKIFKNNAGWGPILHCKANLILCRVASNANIYLLRARYVLSPAKIWRNWNRCALLVRKHHSSSLENKIEHRITIWTSHCTSEYTSRIIESRVSFLWRRKWQPTHFSVLAWRIPGTEEPGGLPSMGSQRVRHYWSDLAAAAESQTDTYMATFTVASFTAVKTWK